MKKKPSNMYAIAIQQRTKTLSLREILIRSLTTTYHLAFRIKAALGIRFNLRIGMLTFYNRLLRHQLAILRLLDFLVKKLDTSGQKQFYPKILRIRNDMTKLYASLESSKFFGLPETEKIAEDLIDRSFDIESFIRHNALDYFRTEEDEKLEEFAALISLNSVFSRSEELPSR